MVMIQKAMNIKLRGERDAPVEALNVAMGNMPSAKTIARLGLVDNYVTGLTLDILNMVNAVGLMMRAHEPVLVCCSKRRTLYKVYIEGIL